MMRDIQLINSGISLFLPPNTIVYAKAIACIAKDNAIDLRIVCKYKVGMVTSCIPKVWKPNAKNKSVYIV
jgi:hypothetical protein